MRETIRESITDTIQDLIDAGIGTSFTKKELNSLGVEIPEVKISKYQIKEIRKQMNLSQTVFAGVLNVSPSSVRQWEQGQREPTGATKVLFELLREAPHLLDYRLTA